MDCQPMPHGVVNDRNHPGYGKAPIELGKHEDGDWWVDYPDNLRVYCDEIGRAILEQKKGGPAWVDCTCCEEWICGIHGCHVFECDCAGVEEMYFDPYEPSAAQNQSVDDEGHAKATDQVGGSHRTVPVERQVDEAGE